MLGVMLLMSWWPAVASPCALWSDPEGTGALANGPGESSGLAASRSQSDIWYTHDDKGGQPLITSFRLDGSAVGDHLVRNASNVDWEDLAAAPCPDAGDCLYIGDIGDNDGSRSELTVYVVPEPQPGDDTVKATFRWIGVYPDGAHDAETLLVHPCTGRVHVVTKDPDGRSGVYRFPPGPADGDVVSLEDVGTITVEGLVQADREVSGGDWHPDGDHVVLRTNSQVFEWRTDPTAPNAHWSDAPEQLGAANEAQGEAIAYGVDGSLVTTSEGQPMQIQQRVCEERLDEPTDCVFPQSGRRCGCTAAPTSTAGGWLSGWAMWIGLTRRRGHRTGPYQSASHRGRAPQGRPRR